MSRESLIPSKEALVTAHAAMKGVSLPAVPQVILDINDELQKSDADLSKVADLISQDTVTSGATLKIVNSPLFSLRREIDSIQQAVMMLGVEKVKSMVVASALKQAFQDDNPTINAIWDESAAIAFCSKRIVDVLDIQVLSDTAYMIGLFMNTGKLLFAKKYPDYGEVMELCKKNSQEGLAEEEKRYGSNHLLLAYLLGLNWGLSESVNLSILARYKESMQEIEDDELEHLHAVLLIADSLVSKILFENIDNEELTKPIALFTAMELLVIDSDDLASVYDDTQEFIGSLTR